MWATWLARHASTQKHQDNLQAARRRIYWQTGNILITTYVPIDLNELEFLNTLPGTNSPTQGGWETHVLYLHSLCVKLADVSLEKGY